MSFFFGGRYRTRTCDPLHVKQVLIPAELIVHFYSAYVIIAGEASLVKRFFP